MEITSIAQLAPQLKNLLGDEVAGVLAKKVKFIQRASKLTGALFAQTLVFTWLAKPNATYANMAQKASELGLAITAQGLEDRFSVSSALFMRELLAETIKTTVVSANEKTFSVWENFNGVYIFDSSTISLPEELAQVWSGCTYQSQIKAGLKLHTRLELKSGALEGPLLTDARDSDSKSKLQYGELPIGSLSMGDMAYWDGARMNELSKNGCFWLSRLRSDLLIYTPQEEPPIDLAKYLRDQQTDKVEVMVEISRTDRVKTRLMAVRLSKEQTDIRRMRYRAECKNGGRTPSKKTLELLEWLIMLTNASSEQLSIEGAMVLYRCRWQIELLFRLWKESGSVDEWRSKKPDRIMTEVYAKLITLVIQHWLLLLGMWDYKEGSLTKIGQVIREYVITLVLAFASANVEEIEAALQKMVANLHGRHLAITKRKKQPSTWQRLLMLEETREP